MRFAHYFAFIAIITDSRKWKHQFPRFMYAVLHQIEDEIIYMLWHQFGFNTPKQNQNCNNKWQTRSGRFYSAIIIILRSI